MASQVSLKSGAQQPDLDYEQDNDQWHCSINRHEPASLFRLVEVGHVRIPSPQSQGAWGLRVRG